MPSVILTILYSGEVSSEAIHVVPNITDVVTASSLAAESGSRAQSDHLRLWVLSDTQFTWSCREE